MALSPRQQGVQQWLMFFLGMGAYIYEELAHIESPFGRAGALTLMGAPVVSQIVDRVRNGNKRNGNGDRNGAPPNQMMGP